MHVESTSSGEPTLTHLRPYCEDLRVTKRRPTRTVWAGKVPIGSDHRIALQTMATTDTRDVKGTVEQCMRIADSGADLVRLTVQSRKEAESSFEIREELLKKGYDIPMVADIHFQPKVALMVAECYEKIRVNPGNFADGAKKFEDILYEDEAQFQAEVDHIEELFAPLVEKCKKLNRAIRIGTNHGSLSARILSYYGDTPNGMVESAVEFANICRKNDFHNFVFSMKASNPLVMVQGYRQLAAKQYELGWDYPLHLGVTEAGEGEDGRMKSAIGIGSLLMDGLGDTIRVSLTEDPEYEIKPCGFLAKDIGKAATLATDQCLAVPEFKDNRDIFAYSKRKGNLPVKTKEKDTAKDYDYSTILHRDGSVISMVSSEAFSQPDQLYANLGCKTAVGMPFKDIATSDSIFIRELPADDNEVAFTTIRRLQESGVGILAPKNILDNTPVKGVLPVLTMKEYQNEISSIVSRFVVTLDGTESDEDLTTLFNTKTETNDNDDKSPEFLLINIDNNLSRVHAARRIFTLLKETKSTFAAIHHMVYNKENLTKDEIIMRSGTESGALLIDGLGDGVLLEDQQNLNSLEDLRIMSFGILQGSRMRNTKTEFVSCPSCGRTLFDLQETTAQISEKTGHLPGVTIAVMGCIVNGPGEMADADFGYVGGAPGKVDLYVGKEMVKKGIPNAEACDALIELIKENDRWIEPSTDEVKDDHDVMA